ncbi:MAG: response regulator [Gemmatimonadaceae bacterium]|nr:response regulator [Gemmatimonadaceae bacterium]
MRLNLSSSRRPDWNPILVVEPNSEVRRALVRALERDGWPVIESNSAESALIGHQQVRLVVSEVELPGMDGYALASVLRARSECLPVLLTSGAHDHIDSDVEGKGPLAFLPKPFPPTSLTTLVRAMLGAPLSSARLQS